MRARELNKILLYGVFEFSYIQDSLYYILTSFIISQLMQFIVRKPQQLVAGNIWIMTTAMIYVPSLELTLTREWWLHCINQVRTVTSIVDIDQ